MNLSIVVPCYNEEESIKIFYDELNESLNEIKDSNYEVIFVDDGSKDKTLANIKKLAKTDSNIKYISFSRNFGKESALYAGLKESSGEYVAIMDVDLQDPPQLLPQMLEILTSKEGSYDIVATKRSSRKGEPKIRSIFAKLFYKIINKITDLDLVDGARDYCLMTRQVVNSLLELSEYNRFSKGLIKWVGFETKYIEYENVERKAGKTSWSFWSLFKYSIEGIVGFTTAPLSISTFFGFLMALISFIIIIFLIIRHYLYSDPVQGWASTVCIIFFIGGIQLFSIGILGKYLEKTYLETKNRPIYLVKEDNIDE